MFIVAFYLILGIGGVVLLVRALGKTHGPQIRRRVRELPPTSIKDAVDGPVRIRGVVEVDNVLTAPISERTCMAWRLVVTKIVRQSGNGANATVVLEAENAVPFVIQDGTGVAAIDTEAGSTLHFSSVQKGVFHEAPRSLMDYLEREGNPLTFGVFSGTSYSFAEEILEDGGEVIVVGAGHWERDPSQNPGGYREFAQRLCVTAPAEGAVILTDDPKLMKGKR